MPGAFVEIPGDPPLRLAVENLSRGGLLLTEPVPAHLDAPFPAYLTAPGLAVNLSLEPPSGAGPGSRRLRIASMGEHTALALAMAMDAIPVEQDALEINTGQMIDGRFRVTRRVGSGGMARVYEAIEVTLGRKVAVKLAVSGERFSHLLEQEGRALAMIPPPAVPAVYGAGHHRGHSYVAMELLVGRTLSDIAAEHPAGKFPVLDVVGHLARLAETLTVVHARGFCHRDLKPDNMIVRANGTVTLIDLGIFSCGSFRASGDVLTGTPEYIAPETISGDGGIDRFSADIYAVGMVAYQLLAGAPAFESEAPTDVLAAQLDTELPDVRRKRPDVPAPLARLLARIGAKDPADRGYDALGLHRALVRIKDGLTARSG